MDFKIEKPLVEEIQKLSFAIGNDVVFLTDFSSSFNDLFKNKVYTAQEIAYCEQFSEPLLRYASTWAAKEAVYKAVKQLDPMATGFKSVEIFRAKPAGQPQVSLVKHGDKFHISLSISHDGDYVWAVALVRKTAC